MATRLATALLLLVIAFSGFAADAPLRFGLPFPLPNTTYGAAAAYPKVVSAGDELYTFWATETDIRMTRIGVEQRGGIPLAIVRGPSPGFFPGEPLFGVVWTGSHFLLASSSGNLLVARTFNRDGEPLSEPVTIAANAYSPHLAINGETLLMLYWSDGWRSAVLSPDGHVIRDGGALGAMVSTLIPYRSGFAAAVRSNNAGSIQLFDHAGHLESSLPIAADALAANENGLLIGRSLDANKTLTAQFIHHDGTAEPPLTIATAPAGLHARVQSFAAVWTGSEWIVSYDETHVLPTVERFHVVALDARATRVTRTTGTMPGQASSAPFRFGGNTFVSWHPDQAYPGPVPRFAEVSTQFAPAEHWTFKAGEQELVATAASRDAMLVVWLEEIDEQVRVRTGVRSRNGDWRESTIATAGYFREAIAASDGENFLIALTARAVHAEQSRVFRVNANGRLIAPEIALDEPVTDAVWNGRNYVLVSATRGTLTGFFVPSTGTAVERKTLAVPSEQLLHHASIAYDGSGYAAVWSEGSDCTFLPCNGSDAIRAVRLTADFQRLDAADFTLAANTDWFTQFGYASVVWTGTDYVIAWTDSDVAGTVAASLPRSGGAPSARFQLSDRVWMTHGGLRASRNELAVVGRISQTSWGVAVHDRVRRTTRDRAFEIDAERGEPKMELLPDGRTAFLVSRRAPFAPQHGSTHVMMSIQEAVPSPGAPGLTARAGNGVAELSWTPAPGVVNGYRLEYRLNDGSWNELTRWFDANERSYTFRIPHTVTAAKFRVRAWSDGGTGPYSDEVTPSDAPEPPPIGRRRSVR